MYAPTFFPNATRVEYALPLRVYVGQELFGIDFALVTIETATVTGTVLDATRQPASQAWVNYLGAGRPESSSTRQQIVKVSPDRQVAPPVSNESCPSSPW